MADAVSKLYAEIGFKINETELKKAQELIKEFAEVLSRANDTLKKAGEEQGIYSKKKSDTAAASDKQALKSAKNEEEINKKSFSLKRFFWREELDLSKQKLSVEKKNSEESINTSKQEAKAKEKMLRQVRSAFKTYLREHDKFKRSLGNLWKFGVGGTIGDAISKSLSSSIPIRDLLLQTGLGFSPTQAIARRFANIGLNIPQEEVLAKLQQVQQNIVEMSFGAKGKTFPYKMLGVAARRNDLLGMVEEAGKAIQGLRPQDAVNLLEKMGFGGEWYSYFTLNERGGGLQNRLSKYGHGQLVEAQTSLVQLRYAFQETAKILTAQLKPAITFVSDALVSAFDGIITAFRNNSDKINEAFSKIGESLKKYIDAIDWEKLPELLDKAVKGFIEGVNAFNFVIQRVAKVFGYKTSDEAEQEDWILRNTKDGTWGEKLHLRNVAKDMVNMEDAYKKFMKATSPAQTVSVTNANNISITPRAEDMAEVSREVTEASNSVWIKDSFQERNVFNGSTLIGEMANQSLGLESLKLR